MFFFFCFLFYENTFIETWACDYGNSGIFRLVTTVILPKNWACDYGNLAKNWACDYGNREKTGLVTTVLVTSVLVTRVADFLFWL